MQVLLQWYNAAAMQRTGLGFFRKFAEIFASQGAPTVSTTLGEKLLPVTMTPAANLPPVSGHRRQILPPFCHSVVDNGGKQWEQYQAVAADTLTLSLAARAEKTFQSCKESLQSGL